MNYTVTKPFSDGKTLKKSWLHVEAESLQELVWWQQRLAKLGTDYAIAHWLRHDKVCWGLFVEPTPPPVQEKPGRRWLPKQQCPHCKEYDTESKGLSPSFQPRIFCRKCNRQSVIGISKLEMF